MYLLIKEKLRNTRIINLLIIIYAFLIPFNAFITLFTLILIFFYLILGNFDEKIYLIKKNNFFKFLFYFILFHFLSLLWSDNILLSLDYIRKYWYFIIIPIIFTSLDKKYIIYVFYSYLSSIFISSIVSLSIFLNILNHSYSSKFLYSPFLDHRYYGIYLVMGIFIAYYLYENSKKINLKIFYLFIIIILSITIFINTSINGYITILVSGLIFALYKMKIKQIFLLFFSFFLAFLISYKYNYEFNSRINNTLKDINEMYTNNKFEGSLSVRVSLLIIGIHSFKDAILLGKGISDNHTNVAKYYEKFGITNFASNNSNFKHIDYHNTYIQIATMLGLVGLILFYLIIHELLILYFENSNIKMISLVFIITYLFLCFGDLALHSKAGLVFFSFFSAIFLNLTRNKIE